MAYGPDATADLLLKEGLKLSQGIAASAFSTLSASNSLSSRGSERPNQN